MNAWFARPTTPLPPLLLGRPVAAAPLRRPSAGAATRPGLAGLVLATILGLGACASPGAGPDLAATTQAALPATWLAPLPAELPHGGQREGLNQWWQQFNDPLLLQLIDAAQAVSPSLASAAARVAEARSTRIAAGAALGPTLDASAGLSRGRQDLSLPVATAATAGLQAGWEIDLFGANRAGQQAALARLSGSEAGWHAARVSVAAEVALAYVGLRSCQLRLQQQQTDADSRGETARLAGLSARAGFQAPADARLAAASAASARAQLTELRNRCQLDLKALVALTGLAEPALQQQLGLATSGAKTADKTADKTAASPAPVPQPTGLVVMAVPAQALAQRPDVFRAGRELLAASADTRQAEAQRLPSLRLSGSLGANRIDTGGGSVSGSTWSLGPLQLSLPLFDGGVRRANVVAAQARYDEALSAYQAQVRAAVREVEEALVLLQGTADRAGDAQIAAEGFDAAFRATEARYRGGLASLFELEDARRSAVQARLAVIGLQQERSQAWISLYRALGGGWSAPAADAAASAAGA